MKERNFKLTQTIYYVIKLMDDKSAGKFIKSVCDYAFHGKNYDGNDITLKSNFMLVKRIIDGQARDRANGMLGAQKLIELRRKRETVEAMKKAVISSTIVSGIGKILSNAEGNKGCGK